MRSASDDAISYFLLLIDMPSLLNRSSMPSSSFGGCGLADTGPGKERITDAMKRDATKRSK